MPNRGSTILVSAEPAAQSRRILSGITLTGNEKIMQQLGLSVVRDQDVPRRKRKLQAGTSGKTRLDIMPPFKLVTFSQLPAEKYDPTFP